MTTSRRLQTAYFNRNHPSQAAAGLKVQVASERDYLYPNAHREYTPRIEAYVHRQDIEPLLRMIWEEKLTPAEALPRLGYLDEQELAFATRQMNGVFRQMEKEGLIDAKGADWLKGL